MVPNLLALRRFGCITYVHSYERKLNPRVKKRVFMGYPERVKGFRVWLIEESKCIISRNVVFREDMMYKDLLQQQQSGTISIPNIFTNNLPSVELAGTNRSEEDSVQGGAVDPETQVEGETIDIENSETDLNEYQLARDRPIRQNILPAKLQDYVVNEEELDEIAGFAYLVTEDAGKPEPSNFQEALSDADSDKWTAASDEEMESLLKNKTWVLVDRVKTHKNLSDASGCSRERLGLLGLKVRGLRPD